MHPRRSLHHLGDGRDSVRDRRQADNYRKYRMAVHFVTERITDSSTVLPMLQDPSGGFQQAINYLQNVLSVIRADRNLALPPLCASRNIYGQCTSLRPRNCGPHATIPDEHYETIMICNPTCHKVGGGVDADYILYISAYSDSKLCIKHHSTVTIMFNNFIGNCYYYGSLAYASSCYYDDANYRPLVGYTNICPQVCTQIYVFYTHTFFCTTVYGVTSEY